MKFNNYMILEFPSKSCNEAFARSAVYPDDLGIVMLRCRILKDNILDIMVKDKGVGIPDVEQARRPAYTTGGGDRSGMGFTIMESFMTSLEITSAAGKGTTVHMRRKLQRRQ